MRRDELKEAGCSKKPLFSMAAAMMIFGSVGITAAMTGLPSFELVFVRCVCAVLFLGAGWILSGQYKHEWWNRREVLRILISGGFLVSNWIFLFRAFESIPVTVAISIYYLAPVFVLLLGSIFFRERITVRSLCSIVICAAGTALVSGISSGSGSSTPSWLTSGVIWAILAALFYALVTLLGKGIRLMSPYAVSMLQTLLGVLILPPFIHFGVFTGLNPGNWAAIAVIGAVHTGLVYYLFFGSVRLLPARVISALVFLDPGIAILLDVFITGFQPRLEQLAGVVLLFGGMSLTLLGKGTSSSS